MSTELCGKYGFLDAIGIQLDDLNILKKSARAPNSVTVWPWM